MVQKSYPVKKQKHPQGDVLHGQYKWALAIANGNAHGVFGQNVPHLFGTARHTNQLFFAQRLADRDIFAN